MGGRRWLGGLLATVGGLSAAPIGQDDPEPLSPMRLVAVTTVQRTTPVLIGRRANPVLQIRVDTEGKLEPLELTELHLTTDGTTDLSDVRSVSAYYSGGRAEMNWRLADPLTREATAFAAPQSARRALVFRGSQQLEPGANWFWVALELSPSADTEHRIDVGCRAVQVGKAGAAQQMVRPDPASPPGALRMGIALRQAGDDGADAYRIPGLVTTNTGALIAVYDVRYKGWGDLPGHIDVGMSRSQDGGRTWEPMKIIMDMGDDPSWRFDGIGDPSVLLDRGTNTVWVAATWSHGNRSWRGSGPGLEPRETGQLMLVRSDDDGKTWTGPKNITKQIKNPRWCFVLQGPGRGITMRDGTLVFPAQYQDPPEKGRLPHSTILYSKDHGTTWQIGTGAFDDTTESAVVELPDGALMLNCRYNRQGYRVVAITRDLGKTWKEHPTSREALREPGACMASLITISAPGEPHPWLAFSNPDAARGPRRRITIKISKDLGRTWPEHHQLLLDEGKSAGYSCLTVIDDKTLGILYEGSGAHMTFQRIPIADVEKRRPRDG